jgi:REP element-mobilizing transposase RayT
VEWLGEIKKGKMALNKFGESVQKQWRWLGEQYVYVILYEFVVMPNHMHGILIINNVGNGRDRSLQIKSLSSLIGAFKTTSSKLIHQNGLSEFKWQKSFYDHIIRNHKALRNMREYIRDNPANWKNDSENI